MAGFFDGIHDLFKREGRPVTAATLTQALDGKLQEVNALDADILARDQRLALDDIQNPGDETSSRELDNLKSKRRRLVATCDAFRREIAAALEREAEADKISEFQAAAEKGRECSPLAKDLIATIVPAAAAARALLAAHAEFLKAIPMRGVNEWEGNRRISAGLRQLIVLALENPHAIEDAIEESVEACMANAASI